MKDDLIRRQAAIDALEEQLDYLQTLNKYENPTAESKWYGVNWARNTIADLPAAQPERKTGKWNFIGDNMFECTSCGVAYTTRQLNSLRNYDTDPYAPKFCPNCGADMRGEQDEY